MTDSNAAYNRRWRAANPDGHAAQQRRQKVRNRALVLLAQVHPDDFAALLEAAESDLVDQEAAESEADRLVDAQLALVLAVDPVRAVAS